jgi:plasmid stabilization system protein ParE
LVNRQSAPRLFHEELARAFELITTDPGVGLRCRETKLPNVRRIHLYRIQYYLYYHIHGESVGVLAFWHSNRGATPRL